MNALYHLASCRRAETDTAGSTEQGRGLLGSVAERLLLWEEPQQHRPACRQAGLLLACDYDFRSAVTVLEGWLNQHLAQRARNRTTCPEVAWSAPSPEPTDSLRVSAPECARVRETAHAEAQSLQSEFGEKLRSQFGRAEIIAFAGYVPWIEAGQWPGAGEKGTSHFLGGSGRVATISLGETGFSVN